MWTIILIIIILFVVVVAISVSKELKKSGGFENYKKQRLQELNSQVANKSPPALPVNPNLDPFNSINRVYRIDYDCAYDFENYPFEIVGEASYQSNISKFAELRDGKGCFTETEARIVREPNNSYDKNACRVDINGLVVGYFAKNHAESWVRLLERLNISDSSEVYVKAVIVGGGSKDYKLGVRLDIPSRIANSAKYIKEI
ncbi:HIRAN domain-containing protein [Acinetobacter courvalinii]|uniref:HIRAN domain-containing protein n=1 Tax=Acinetobacter courvalinii TaxID=280147 RepID=UPI0028965B32|nr:HIRAN domain-containing protein [Acinetobacter courvalinii]